MKPYYEDEDTMIYHADFREIIPLLPIPNLILTDPPYGLGKSNTEKNKYKSFADDPDEVVRLVSWCLEFYSEKRLVMTPGQFLMFRYPEPSAIGSFFYPAGAGSCSWGFVGWQPIFYYGKDPYLQTGRGRAINSKLSTERAEEFDHPCPKPIGQWQWLLERTSLLGELIIDPFMGTGTTLRCAKDSGRKAIGIEIEESYCEIAAHRLLQNCLFKTNTCIIKSEIEQVTLF